MADSTPDSAKAQMVPRYFANGFAIGASNSDILLDFRIGGEPIATVHMSYTLAKTLSQKLAYVIDEFEKKVGRSMLTTDEVDKAMKPSAAKVEK